MKYKATRKEIKAGYRHVIRVGYCELQNLLSQESPEAYIVRREGWAADIYGFGDTAISTGYAPFGDIKPSWEKCHEYDKAAEVIRHDTTIHYEEQRERLNELIKAFIKEVEGLK